jgi:hypothetical protein
MQEIHIIIIQLNYHTLQPENGEAIPTLFGNIHAADLSHIIALVLSVYSLWQSGCYGFSAARSCFHDVAVRRVVLPKLLLFRSGVCLSRSSSTVSIPCSQYHSFSSLSAVLKV